MNVTGSLTVPGLGPTTAQPTSPPAQHGAGHDRLRSDVSAGFAHVSVLDYSRADADARVIGDVIIGLDPSGPNFPIRFMIEVVGEIEAHHSYCVRAVVRAADGTLQWTTDTIYPVDLTGRDSSAHVAGGPTLVDVGALTLIHVGRTARPLGSEEVGPEQSAPGTAVTPETSDLFGAILGAWVCTRLDNGEVVADHPPVFEFSADGRVAGTTGCNRFFAEWELDGSTLTVGPAATTLRACTPELTAQEATVLALLSDATSATVRLGEDELRIDTPGSHSFIGERTTRHDM